MKHKLLIPATLALATTLHAQKPMGTISTADAQVSGGLEVSASRANLLSNTSITAYDHTAQIDLARGGAVNVCATSAFHLLRSGTGDALLFALDRGAMEIRSLAQPQDAILTPDLRFTILTPGTLDLRMRVNREGDTCVENHGDTAPVLLITEGFGDATYHLAPNQHVLFEHGSLREVVDRERSDCGCPQSRPGHGRRSHTQRHQRRNATAGRRAATVPGRTKRRPRSHHTCDPNPTPRQGPARYHQLW